MKAMWISDAFAGEVARDGFNMIDGMSVLLTHLGEVIRNNLAQLLSYKDMRSLLDRLDPEYKRLIDDICPSQISYSGLQAVLKLLLGERVSVRNLHLILGRSPRSCRTRGVPSRSSSTSACACRSRSAAISPTAAC